MAYIDKNKALEILNRNSITKKITLADGISIYDSISNLPTADVVEVVRCKNCRECDIYYPEKAKSQKAIKYYFCKFDMNFVQPNDFCSFGKRKEGD